MWGAAEVASLGVFAFVCRVVEAPAVSALCDWWAILERTKGAVAAEGCQ